MDLALFDGFLAEEFRLFSFEYFFYACVIWMVPCGFLSTGTLTVHMWTGSSVGSLTSYPIRACPKEVSKLLMKYFFDICITSIRGLQIIII
jgi:hypothetical protein